MNRLVDVFFVGLGALTLAACGSGKHQAASPADRLTADIPAEEQAQQGQGAPTGRPPATSS